ncbi:TIR domain-containing protein [Peribacillus castrilensis]|uniref:SLOG domain-containing protein n=1 Tax=Peribacillus TaxID=2675229 RepID=UPI003871C3F5
MRIYIVDPKLTLGNEMNSFNFFNVCRNEIEMHVETTIISSEMVTQSMIAPQKQDIIIFFNRADNEYPAFFTTFLKEVDRVGAQFLPIAMTELHRVPPTCIPNPQSYDVKEALERRKLTISQYETVAIAFAREAVSLLQPTLTRRNMVLFLSHRRSDGEKIAGAFYDELCARAQNRFRDLSDILVGENAQEIIEGNLRKSDALVFLDTPKCGESEWIKLEIRMALAMNLPIVWIKLGSDTDRVAIEFRPADKPHFEVMDVDLNMRSVDHNLVDSVIHRAFEISRDNAKSIFGHLKRIRELEREGKIRLELLNQYQYLYEVSIPRQGFRYVQKPMTHVISLYGRIPQEEDKNIFSNSILQQGYSTHPRLGHAYDAAIMLAPIASQNKHDLIDEPHFIDSCDEYVNSLELHFRSIQPKIHKKKGVIISGAFPDCEPEHQQSLWNALYAFVQAILDRDGTIIFGSHPTFQQVIIDVAKLRKPNDYIQAVHMYISKHFVTQAMVDENMNYASITATDEVNNDRNKSLTAMRTAMIQDEDASCMIVIGGKTKRSHIQPGVDEEIELARSRNLPVFLIGSVGGRTAEIATEFHSNGWRNKPNQMSEEFNEELMVSVDYGNLANKLFNKLGL